MEVCGYNVGGAVCETGDFLIYQAWKDDSGMPFLLKTPAARRALPSVAQRLEHEYEVTRELDPQVILRPIAMERHANKVALVLENWGCQTLANRLRAPMEIGQFLRIAIKLVKAVQEVHRHDLVHKDIKPDNILLGTETGQVKLSGFGMASRLPRERQPPEPPEVIAGTLAYMAPEQTGRMNRSIDSRTDLYALGVTFYEMLTGTLPFTAADPMEWVHCHIAKEAVPLRERRTEIPEPLSAIVTKLLAKAAEERYQIALGLESDLQRCLEQWESHHHIDPFPLGANDIPDRLLIPEKLYGREREIDLLLAAFDRVVASGAPELVLVSGYSGIGKSSVVSELHKALVPPRGLFSAGKFDQYKQDIPYATLGQAFQTLIRQILAKSDEEVGRWRDDLQEALGPNGQLIINLIPELEHIIGSQQPVPELPPQHAQNRFQFVFQRFLGVFARKEHPLALFLDDLQWLDAATLDMIEYLITEPEVKHLLLVGAYRDNEVGPLHPLMRMLENVRKVGASIHEIVLGPLVIADVVRLIADALHCKPERARPLAELVQEKTGGNPFFVIQFLTMLAEEKLLAFDLGTAEWAWNMEGLCAKGHTDNVVTLMAGKLKRLPQAARNALKQLACLGNVADVATLVMAYDKSEEQINSDLWAAVRAGLVLCQAGSYRFLHDRVQEAAYSLIPPVERAAAHLRIGRLLASRTAPEDLEEKVFEIVNQLNRGAALITSPKERARAAELNLIAGVRAKKSTAYKSALKYFRVGRARLRKDCWSQRYSLTYALEYHRAECEFLTGHTVAAEERLLMLSLRAENLVDLAAVACLQMDLYTTLGQADRGVQVCLEFLRGIGVEWSPHPTKQEVMEEYEQIWRQLGSRSIEDLLDLPQVTDPDLRATFDVLLGAIPSAFFTDENLRDLVICRMANLSLEHGNSDASSYGYVLLAVILGPQFGDYDTAFRFGKLGLDLVKKHGLDRFEARVNIAFGCLVIPCTKPLRTGSAFLRRAFDTANKLGDLTHAGYSIHGLISTHFASGEPLGEIQEEAENGLEFGRKARFAMMTDILITQLQLIRTLRGLTPDFSSFNDSQFDENRFEQHLEASPLLAMATCWYWIRKLEGRFYAGDFVSAIAAASKAEPLLWTSPSFNETTEYHFFCALARAALYGTASADEWPRHFNSLLAHYKQIKQEAENCPENFENRAALVAAEIARIEGRELDAQRLYEEAIRSARENGFVQNEGLANELAATFYTKRGFKTTARAYLQEACFCYVRWGADGKVKQLEGLHPWLLENKMEVAASIAHEGLDLLSVVKAQQAISSKIITPRLAETLLRIALENAGAQKGYLFVEPDAELMAVVSPGQSDRPIEFNHAPPPPGLGVSASIFNFVKRTRETVILNDATSGAGPFSHDEYLLGAKPKSVLCMPIMRQAKLIGILYLENSLAAGAFTPDRRVVLEMLASQAAISLETAKLYSHLQRSQNNLQDQTLILRSILDSMGDGVVVANEHGEFLLFNPAAEEVLGVAATTGGPEHWSRQYGFYLPDQTTPFPVAELPLSKAIRGEPSTAAEIFMRNSAHPAGRWLSVTARPLTEKTGIARGGVAVFSDVTDRKRAEVEVRELNRKLEERGAKDGSITDLPGERGAPEKGNASPGEKQPSGHLKLALPPVPAGHR